MRVVPQLDNVFVADLTWFRETDPWYHERLADLYSFPNWSNVDLMAKFPDGAHNGYMPMIAWLSLGDKEAAFIPPIVGALTLFFVYLIGKEVFSGKVGLLAAALVAVIPGEFLHRTLLGFTDHHCLEAFCMSAMVYFLLKTKKTWSWKWAAAFGASLTLYLISWTGALLLMVAIGLWVWWECLAHLEREESLLPMVKTFTPACALPALITFGYTEHLTAGLILALSMVPVGMWLLITIVKKRSYILFALTIAVPIALAFLGAQVNYYQLLAPIFWGGGSYIQEAMPLGPGSILSIYGLAFLLALPSFWFYRSKNSLFLIWTAVFVIAGIGQRRWGYYTTIPVALLASAFTFKIGDWVKPITQKAVIGIVILFLLLPNIQGTLGVINLPNQMTADWYVTCTWIRQNTPDDELFDLTYSNLEPAPYGVLAWWDYGHWIIRIAHRVPLSSPTQTSPIPGEFYTATTEEGANARLLDLDIRYVLIDAELLTLKWEAIRNNAHVAELPVEQSFLYTLWREEATTWQKVYERGYIKLFERIEQ